MKNIITVLLFFVIKYGYTQQEVMDKYAETITNDDLYAHLSILASTALGGRETGKVGQKMAATYISEQFKKLGLQGPSGENYNDGYYQPMTLYSSKVGSSFIKTKKNTFYNDYKNLFYYGNSSTNGNINSTLVYVGEGTKKDFENKNVKGKVILTVSDNERAWRKVAETAKDLEVSQIFVVNKTTDSDFESFGSQMKHYLDNGRLSLEKPSQGEFGVFFLKPSVASKIMGIDLELLANNKKAKNVNVTYNANIETVEVESENVLGYMEGTDLKDELLIITAHYDHVGTNGDEIYYGADDDASGTSAILELAQAFTKAKKEGHGPRRSVLFMTVTGEEKGLLGSQYYTENPIYKLENTVVNLNIDMIGRVDPPHKNNENYVYLVGSDKLSTELHDLSEKANTLYTKMELDYTYNDQNHPDRIYYRSDHWNFAKNNIPIIFYFNGVHEDYHKPTDTVDKINFDMLKKRTQLVYYTAWIIANRNERLVIDKIQNQSIDNK